MMASVITARSESAAACARPLDPGTMTGISYRFCRCECAGIADCFTNPN